MQSCKKCQITIRGEKERCPLCGGILSGEPESPAFPVIPRKRVSRLSFLRVSLFLFVAFEAAMAVLMLSLERVEPWMLMAVVAGVFGILDIALAVYYRNNVLKLVVMEIYIGLGVALLVDLYTGKPYWSINMVIPMIFMGLTIVIAALGKALQMPVEEYIMYLLFDVIVSTGLQGILILCGVNTFRIPALISIAFVIVFFLGMVIFNHRVFGKESKKLFNV